MNSPFIHINKLAYTMGQTVLRRYFSRLFVISIQQVYQGISFIILHVKRTILFLLQSLHPQLSQTPLNTDDSESYCVASQYF